VIVKYTVAVTTDSQKLKAEAFHKADNRNTYQMKLRQAFAKEVCIYDTEYPTTSPTSAPTAKPTHVPERLPVTAAPTTVPATALPTKGPTPMPTKAPTKNPTNVPTIAPTKLPTVAPTNAPTKIPTNTPTKVPSVIPTTSPSDAPTASPTKFPTTSPTKSSELKIWRNGVLQSYTRDPTNAPTMAPTLQYAHTATNGFGLNAVSTVATTTGFKDCATTIKFTDFSCSSSTDCPYVGTLGTPAPTPAVSVVGTYEVVGAISLTGFTAETFTNDHKKAFKSTLKSTLGLGDLSDDQIVLVVAASTRRLTRLSSRRLAGEGIKVSYTIKGVSSAVAESAKTTLSASASDTFTSSLKAEIQKTPGLLVPSNLAAGVTAPTTADATTSSPTAAPTTAVTPAATVALSAGSASSVSTLAIFMAVLAVWTSFM
jgi:hypothetical protein